MRIYSFDKLIGNQHCINLLKTGIMQDTLPHFSIFYGIGGIGKSTCAEITALAMTCQHTKDGSPCLECETCRSNLEAIKTGTKSVSVAKINLGQNNTKIAVDQMIKEIFTLQSSERNCVYVLEEAHALSPALQTSLLEEIDRLDNHTYIIICTTKLNELIPELRSRAILFNFKRLTDKESSLLLDKYLKDNNKAMEGAAKTAILNYTKGIPREITKAAKFLSENTTTLEQLLEHLEQISDTVYCSLFQTLKYGTMHDLHCFINEEINKYPTKSFIIGLKEFYLKMFFCIEGGVNTLAQFPDFSEAVATIDVLKTIDLFKLCNMITKLSTNLKQVDFSFFLINLYQFFHNKKVSNIAEERKQAITTQKSIAVKSANEIEKASENLETLHSFSASNVKFNFGGDNHKS